jgi:hypothetical protein
VAVLLARTLLRSFLHMGLFRLVSVLEVVNPTAPVRPD